MNEVSTLILDKTKMTNIIKRIAYEVYEQNFSEKQVVVAGVKGNGQKFADMIVQELANICDLSVYSIVVSVNKEKPLASPVLVDAPVEMYKGKVIVLVDDVMYSGKTLAYAFGPFLQAGVKKIQTAVLVDRGYRHYPVSADFVGYALATTIKEQIEVSFDKKNYGVYLT